MRFIKQLNYEFLFFIRIKEPLGLVHIQFLSLIEWRFAVLGNFEKNLSAMKKK